jgi:hypothetical protein
MSAQEFFCGNPICKRSSFKREDENEPWPLRCQICFWLNVPDEQRGLFRAHPKYSIPTLTTVMVRSGGSLVAFSSPKSPPVTTARSAAKGSVSQVAPSRAVVTPATTPAVMVNGNEGAPLVAQPTPKLAQRRPSPPSTTALLAPSSTKYRGLVVASLVIGAILLLVFLLR